jgi:hypothetical protein
MIHMQPGQYLSLPPMLEGFGAGKTVKPSVHQALLVLVQATSLASRVAGPHTMLSLDLAHSPRKHWITPLVGDTDLVASNCLKALVWRALELLL